MAQQFLDFDAPYHDEKEDLLHAMRPVFEPPSRLSAMTLYVALALFLVVFSVFMPKIYLRNTLYYKSRDVAKLEHQYETLYEERQLLRAQLEQLRFKSQIDGFFVLRP